MTGPSDGDIRGIEMSDREIDEFLTEQGYGTLSVTSDARAYAVPISLGYDGDAIYMNLITFGDESQKMDYLAETEVASVVVMDVENRFDWRSVVVRGPTADVPEDEEDYHESVLDDNGWFPVIYPPTQAMTDVARIKLEPEETSGRKGEQRQST